MKTNDEVYDSQGKLVYGYEQLESELRNLARTIPVAHEELGNIAENAGQLGIATQDVVGFTEVVAKLGHTTNLSYEEASTALAQFLNVTGSGTDTVSNLSSSIVALGNNTAATEKDILLMSQRWATTGAMIGLTDDQIVAFSASLISMGVNVEAGGSALQRFGQKVNSHVLDAGDGLALLAETAGMTASEFSDAWNNEPAKAIESFLQGLDGVVKEGGNANQLLKELGITSVNELNALLALAGGHEQLADALGLSAEAYSENTALSEEFATFAETTSAQVQILQNKIKDIAIEFGGPLASALTSALNAAEPWIEKLAEMATGFAEMDEEGQRNILMWAGIAAAAGPVISIFGNMVTGIGGLISGFGTVKTLVADVIQWFGKITTPKGIADTATELGKIPGAATSAGAGATLFSNPWVIAGGVAIGAVAGFVAYMNHEANKPFKAHNEAVAETEGAYQTWFDAMMEGQSAIEAFNDSAQDNAKESTNAYNELADEIRNTNLEITELINTQTEKSEPFLGSLAQNIEVNGQRVSIVVESLIDQMRDLGRTDEEIEAVTDAYSNYGNMLTNSFTRIADDFQNNTAMTEKWASAHIQTVKDVAQSTVERYEEMRQAELDANAQRRENLNETEAWLTEQNSITNAKYDEQVQIVNNAFATIQGILANAKDETGNWRQLTEKEVVSLLQAYQNLAEGTGQSLHEMDEVGQLIGSNMSAMVTTMGLDFLMSAGLIDQATMEMIASAGTAEEKIDLLSEALGDYDTIQIEGKDIFVNTDEAQTEIQALIDAGTEWDGFTPEQKMFMMQTMGDEAVKYLLDTIGIDWNTLTPEQKELIANVQNAEDVENVVHEIGNWNNLSIEDKILNLEAQVANDQILSIIQSRDLWNQGTFYEEFIAIDTNAPDAEQKVLELINRTLEVMGMPPLQIATETNASESAGQVGELRDAVAGVSPETHVTFTAGVGGVSEAAGTVQEYSDAANSAPGSKTSEVKSNVFSTVANTIALVAYNSATDKMQSKEVTATTNTPNLPKDTNLIKNFNEAMRDMFNKTSTATTKTPNLPRDTNLVKDWTSAMRETFNKTSTLTTKTPNIASNTSSVWSWISALNSAYNRTSTLTTNRVTRYSTIGISPRGYKDGGHIDAYADGGNIKWGGMFANGGNVPQGYMGIVGEAGPELFHVTKSGVSITPLASNEKIRGVEGAIEDYMQGKGSGGGDSYSIDINISDVTIRDDRDIDKLTDSISERLVKQMQRDKKMRKGSVVGFG